ncbi:transferase hexapeptide (six repeat-containing protein) [Chitinophaga terrae (ex Kim and Jung 2007)]|uniref:Transferase hexapeptide (Six repeat-containing protein) n=1 Tax=Chitinophaga terrae (ex Kim and Jung 2007) TaxID=408074 RepID=A0A1H3XXI9_9BACT|nr:acyltransferase [Chitinophaga terrae (ex Kim and Jung 2007)]GEP89453.1 hypothetical protein CTE07_10980 [Chitinophaga terrae (ex Kim and Jung 2007)]SEA04106.1 transferase hexapeptide (six repeat-containing protein) [Chitinophaga terrae (ex Kim and Jung 2007)]
MRNLILKLILITKFDKICNKLKGLLQDAEIARLEQKSGNRIKFVRQGFNGISIGSYDGDLTKFKIDKTSHLKSDSYIDCSGGVTIGRYFHCGKGLTIFSSSHNYECGDFIPYDNVTIERPVVIKDFVWSGANVTIIPGITIGEGAVLATNAVITKDVPDYAVVGGNPAVILKYRDKERFMKLKEEGRFY